MNYILIVCILAVGHSLFSAIALMTLSHKLSNRLLALLLVLLALRIGKSVIQMIIKPEMSYLVSIIGLTAMAAIGPVLYFLLRSLFDTKARATKSDYLHLLPAFLLPFLYFVLDWNVLSLLYYIITGHVLLYLAIGFWFILSNREVFKTDDLKWKWAILLLLSVSLLWCSFVLQVTNYHPIVYATNVITAAVLFYGISFWALTRARLFLPESPSKRENTNALDELGKRVKEVLETEQLYIDSNLNVSLLATRLKSPPYLVSKAINHYFNQTFSEVLINYRIGRAEELLLSPDSKSYTIEAVAFESGFSTLSAFYVAFKKIHKTTPAQFRLNKGSRMKIAK
ncbi:helix-turn-helix domain-containing protein [Chryseolinea sp. H1M3-3]|uniref:helix-turn-helix domain-containing protein n=1 Tax=Chryseolinea sp. H1M3-3 TaxID=3034144 RepID=UPI0023ED3A9B|nr:helix-turn-helix domain-containing protein [Chryseolinea sp. H1M3-3]